MTTSHWNAAKYHTASAPHQDWGRAVLDRLELHGGETVLDLGCGTGRISERLLERLPRGRVIGVDGSQAMVARARETLAAEIAAGRAAVVHSDLLELALDGPPADAAISTATFHWIHDHERLFARVRDALAPGGQFVAQCGGAGNIAATEAAIDRVNAEEPFAACFEGWPSPWHYATPEDTRRRLEDAGFAVRECWLQPWPVTVDDPRGFFETIILSAQLERVPDELRSAYVDRVIAESPTYPEVDYVRLNWVARRR